MIESGFIPEMESPLTDVRNLYLYGSGTGFYDDVCPPEKVNFGMASTCAHWLSKRYVLPYMALTTLDNSTVVVYIHILI